MNSILIAMTVLLSSIHASADARCGDFDGKLKIPSFTFRVLAGGKSVFTAVRSSSSIRKGYGLALSDDMKLYFGMPKDKALVIPVYYDEANQLIRTEAVEIKLSKTSPEPTTAKKPCYQFINSILFFFNREDLSGRDVFGKEYGYFKDFQSATFHISDMDGVKGPRQDVEAFLAEQASQVIEINLVPR